MVAGGGAAEGSWGQRRPRLSPGPAGGQDLAPPRLEGPRRGWTTAPREGRGLLQARRGPCAQDGASPRLARRRLLSPRPAVCSGPSEGHEDSLSSRERALRIPAGGLACALLAQAPRGPSAPSPAPPATPWAELGVPSTGAETGRGLTRGRRAGRSFSHTPRPGPEGNGGGGPQRPRGPPPSGQTQPCAHQAAGPGLSSTRGQGLPGLGAAQAEALGSHEHLRTRLRAVSPEAPLRMPR